MKLRKIVLFSILGSVLILASSCRSQQQRITQTDITHPKREFRGAWMSTAWQTRYRTMHVEEMKSYFTKSLDQLQAMGINAIIFQVRPQADAFYKSKYEPWSVHLSGTQGKAPDKDFDPLEFMIAQCHQRGMELHAWLNPYRVTSSVNDELVSNHLYFREPDRFVSYGNKIYFDPGIPKNREYMQKIVKDILLRYAVDAIHMDDYFYPYPIAGEDFPDQQSFARYAKQQGYKENQLADWRRNNVNMLIKDIRQTIKTTKPWVRFGISPFGIYQNRRSTADGSGSETTGLEGYSALYADIKLWAKEKWIDYNMPQVYWEIGHAAADYTTLIKWWNDNNFEQPLYIGQDVKRTMDAKNSIRETQLDKKITLSRSMPNVGGNSFWPAYELLDNYGGVGAKLRKNYHQYPALIPAYTHLYNKTPKKIDKLKSKYTNEKHLLYWESNHADNDPITAQYYVVYRFDKDEKENIHNAKNIVHITKDTFYALPYEGGNKMYKYVVTAVDAFHNESKPRSKKLKL